MQTLTINIKDKTTTQKLLSLLEHFKKDGIEVILSETIDKNSDMYFEKRKTRVSKLIDDIENGKEKLYSLDEFEKDMDTFEKELILKYGN